uniref:Uncharacterized protein n=1 Tax=Physcomitrium patens TaxID=3218 RepID=A0A2K1K7R0_PHYPA|nr:hypothetical protein PHYPA_011703 [Physcomitrium patens]
MNHIYWKLFCTSLIRTYCSVENKGATTSTTKETNKFSMLKIFFSVFFKYKMHSHVTLSVSSTKLLFPFLFFSFMTHHGGKHILFEILYTFNWFEISIKFIVE